MLFRPFMTGALVTAALATAAEAQTTRLVPSQYSSIQAAINASITGDTVLVSPGTYEVIDGSFQGKDITVKSSDGPGVTYLDAKGMGRHFIIDQSETTNALLEGFTLVGGKAPGGVPGMDGGNFCLSAVPTAGGPGHNGGSILIALGSGLTVSRCRFVSNAAGKGGDGGRGQAFCFADDGEDGGPGGHGGAIWSGGVLVARNCVFYQNAAGRGGNGGRGGPDEVPCVPGGDGGPGGKSGDGGAVFLQSSFATLELCTFAANRADLGGAGGAGGSGGWCFGTLYGDDGSNGSPSNQAGDVAMAPGVTLDLSTCIRWGNAPAAGAVDPLFASLATGDLRLTPASPFIDAHPASVTSTTLDWIGNPRKIDSDPGTPSSVVDSGAIEFGPWDPYFGLANVYVDAASTDPSPDGTSSKPFPTIAQGAAAVPAGQFLGVVGGTYDESVLTLSNHMIINALGNGVVVIE